MPTLAIGSPERQLNLADPLDALNGLVGDQSSAAVAALANGNFVVVYESLYQGAAGDTDIMAVEVTAAGTVVAGSTFRVERESGHQLSPDVVARSGGGYAAVWRDDGDSGKIKLAVVPPGAAANPTEFTVDDKVAGLTLPSIAAFGNGSTIVTYETTGGGVDAWFAIVNAAGTGYIKSPTLIEASREFTAVAARDDLALVAYAGGGNVRLKTCDSNGNLVDSELVGSGTQPEVAALSDGRFVIVWRDGAGIHGRIYDPDTGNFSGAAFDVDLTTPPGIAHLGPQVVGLPNGGFAVSYTDDTGTLGDASGFGIRIRLFDADGDPVGSEVLVNAGTSADQVSPAMAVDAAGRILVAWSNFGTENTTDTSPSGIQGRLIKVIGDAIDGSDAGETIPGTAFSETITALGGNDTVNAGNGDDTVDGGEGKDTLSGEAGADAFLFDVKLKKGNRDHITDFAPGSDEIQLDQSIFKKLKVGDLKKNAFYAHKNADEAKDGKDRIVYDTKSGEMRYDADGDGGKKAKLFAILDGSPNDVAFTDFVVIA